jgi:hypothetical protein
MPSVIDIFKHEVKDLNNKKQEIIFSIIGLHTQLLFAVEQQLKRLQSLDLNQFADELEYYEYEDLDDNILEDLGFNRFDDPIPEYVREYATVIRRELNYATSITGIGTAIDELRNLIAAESTPTFQELNELSGLELEILCEQLFTLIKQFEKYYSSVGVLQKKVWSKTDSMKLEQNQDFRLWIEQLPLIL